MLDNNLDKELRKMFKDPMQEEMSPEEAARMMGKVIGGFTKGLAEEGIGEIETHRLVRAFMNAIVSGGKQ